MSNTTTSVKDSQKTQKLFDNAVDILNDALTSGEIENKEIVDIAMKSLVTHIKAKNNEIKADALRFMVNKTILPDENVLRDVLKRTLPEYAGE